MQKLILLTSALFLARISNAQSIKTFVKENQIQIHTIEPDSTDFTDLKLIGESIGNAKIVMLGEQDHGDAPTFLAKTRLIKYLHEKLGFSVLAFESDFFGLNYGFDKLEKNKPSIDSFIRKNIFPIWTGCNTCENLFYNYIPSTYQTEQPLRLTGFDNQLILGYSSKYLSFYLDSLFQSLNIPIIKEPNYKSEILPFLDSLRIYYFKSKVPDGYTKFETYLLEIQKQVSEKLSVKNFWIQVINSMLSEFKEFHLNRKSKAENLAAFNFRDSQMASNLKWLSEVKFPNEKIIVWAANAHVAKYSDSSNDGSKMISMGSFLTRDEKLMNETYVIGFTSYQGKAGRLGMKTYAVRKPKSNGFENWIDKTYDYAFVDFSDYRTKFSDQTESFFLKGLGHYIAFKKDWTKVFDGIYFIREMYPCKR